MIEKARIVKRTAPDGSKCYVIQQRHFLFRWWWIDAGINMGTYCQDSFKTIEDAQRHLCWFDGTPWVDDHVDVVGELTREDYISIRDLILLDIEHIKNIEAEGFDTGGMVELREELLRKVQRYV